MAGKRELRELFADIPAKRRGAFLARLYGKLEIYEAQLDVDPELNVPQKLRALRDVMAMVDSMEGIAKTAAERAAIWHRLSDGLTVNMRGGIPPNLPPHIAVLWHRYLDNDPEAVAAVDKWANADSATDTSGTKGG